MRPTFAPLPDPADFRLFAQPSSIFGTVLFGRASTQFLQLEDDCFLVSKVSGSDFVPTEVFLSEVIHFPRIKEVLKRCEVCFAALGIRSRFETFISFISCTVEITINGGHCPQE
ncbi:hypothetical protein CEXT_235221 [Caerostris extrusa]|uniref:Uncharacterized protein n=1 Tax=Caerostris extrusa TaxID=172846 RepID=A0AAV4WBA6_CAEEX|nr:hypothetical protein CEXT_235221 [Caerostris extrusa]